MQTNCEIMNKRIDNCMNSLNLFKHMKMLAMFSFENKYGNKFKVSHNRVHKI